MHVVDTGGTIIADPADTIYVSRGDTMPHSQPFARGDRIGLVDGDVIRLGTIAGVYGGGDAVTITWDDGHEDRGVAAVWSPGEIKRIA